MLTVEATPSTGRLLLRAWEEQDVPALAAAYRDPEMRRWLRTSITTAAEARRVVEARRAAHKAGDRLSFAILEATGAGAGHELAGGISLRGLRDGGGRAEVGY
jgi:RimJ/RimL family protein N-acetyltransferase